jgi:hypothetical protein
VIRSRGAPMARPAARKLAALASGGERAVAAAGALGGGLARGGPGLVGGAGRGRAGKPEHRPPIRTARGLQASPSGPSHSKDPNLLGEYWLGSGAGGH